MRMTDGEGKCNTPARWVTGANRETVQERDSKKKKGHSQLMLHYILPPTSLKCHFILVFRYAERWPHTNFIHNTSILSAHVQTLRFILYNSL